MATNTTQVPNAGDASRVSTVLATRLAARPMDATGAPIHVHGKRVSDARIVECATIVLREAQSMGIAQLGWVETLRTMRWTPTLDACDYARFSKTAEQHDAGSTPTLYAQACAIASKPVRKPRASKRAK